MFTGFWYWILCRTPHCLNFYQSDTCWKVSVKYRRFCFYFTTLIRASKWGKWGPKTFLQMHLLLREQIYFHKISSGTWYSPPITCPSMCLGWRLVSSHHRSWNTGILQIFSVYRLYFAKLYSLPQEKGLKQFMKTKLGMFVFLFQRWQESLPADIMKALLVCP